MKVLLFKGIGKVIRLQLIKINGKKLKKLKKKGRGIFYKSKIKRGFGNLE